MYKLVNEAGNAHVIAENERMRDQFLARGFRIEAEPEKPKPAAPKKRKVAQTDGQD